MIEQDRPASENETVVVVDDDAAVCSSLAFSLGVDGFDVQTYANGEELLEQERLPARGCMIIDYFLPGMNGLELAAVLRQRQVHLPIILITTQPNPKLRQSAAAEGIEIVEKPLFGNSLSETVRVAVGSAANGVSAKGRT